MDWNIRFGIQAMVRIQYNIQNPHMVCKISLPNVELGISS